jgi:hypothetical protein
LGWGGGGGEEEGHVNHQGELVFLFFNSDSGIKIFKMNFFSL